MWKKIFIQIILFLLIIFLIFYTYKIYFKNEKKVKINEIQNTQKENIINSNNSLLKEDEEAPNLIKDLKYVSKDILGNEYIISSEYSTLNLEKTNIINMEEVNATITMLDKEPIFVKSKFAIYDNETYETIFFDNVVINYLDNIVNSEKFEISVKDNFAQVSEKVIYQNPNIKLEADVIEIDLITKNSKIFMIDDKKKIKITNN
tara:strand:+ start:465 stop:1076 length:612 start_codon:yes stop_codon:yes gene_type:complete